MISAMAPRQDIETVRRCVSNEIEARAFGEKQFAGVIGDAPSHYSKSPALWNAAFAHFRMNATYLPFDVGDAKLGDLLEGLKTSDRFLGASVTVPHKVRVMDFLDEVDAGAARINAVNTIVRNKDGNLIGYNTDGEGFLDSIVKAQPDRDRPFLASLKAANILLLGAGGSARAVAFHVAGPLEGGALLICNRTADHARALADEIRKTGCSAEAILEDDLIRWAPQAALLVNCTTKGQGGIRRLSNGMATLLESYSALAPARPPSFHEAEFGAADFPTRWRQEAQADIDANQRASLRLAESIPAQTGFYDLIYHPEETIFLQHGRLSGHATMNGKAMIINQAAIAFCRRICRAELIARGMDSPAAARQVLEVMYRAW